MVCIGGGILIQGLLDGLVVEGVMIVCGNVGMVGWCFWVMNGGYGIMVVKYGFGCDQIVGVRVVFVDGCIVVVDEWFLKVLWGVGFVFGVIVEFEIKVYLFIEVRVIIVFCCDGKG